MSGSADVKIFLSFRVYIYAYPFIGLIFSVSNRVRVAIWMDNGMEMSKTVMKSIANSDLDLEKRQHWFAEKKGKSS